MTSTVNNGPFIRNIAPKWLGGTVSDSAVRSYTEVRIKNYSKRVKPLGQALYSSPTSFYAEKRVFKGATVHPPGGGQSAADSQAGGFSLPYAEIVRSLEAAKMALRDKIKGEDWNVSVFMAELPETRKYLQSSLTQVLRTIRAVKRGDMREVREMVAKVRRPNSPYPKSFKKRWEREFRRGLDDERKSRDVTYEQATGALAQKWLEWRYAISPVMYDVDDMLKYLNRSSLTPTIRRSVAGGGFEGTDRKIAKNTYSETRLTSWSVVHRYGCYYIVQPSVVEWKRLGILNPLGALYELTPFSFVLDWFIPVGQYIGSLDALAGVQILSTWSSEAVTSEMLVYPAGYLGSSSGGSQRIKSYSRVPNPGLSMTMPSFNMSLNASRFCDTFALARSILIKDAPRNYRIF